MRFLHTADWQIGMKAAVLGDAGARVREERLAAGRRVVEAAKSHSADFVLVAGDLFEDNAVDRGENITTIFINNAVYGMTGGQMAPTTLTGQKTSTTPYGRDKLLEGQPIRMSEILATIDATAYLERVAVNSPANIRTTKQAIKKAFQVQIDKLGFSMVEILSPCPTNWKMTPLQAWQWIDKEMNKVFPLGVLKDVTGKKDAD